jgi:hypothetical protein
MAKVVDKRPNGAVLVEVSADDIKAARRAALQGKAR